MKFNKKAVATLGIFSIMGSSLLAGVSAAGNQVKGYISGMNIHNNGAILNLPQDSKPVVINDRTYLPVRALGEALGQKVDWSANDPNNVYISGSVDPVQYSIMAQSVNQAKIDLVAKDSEIKTLKEKVTSLEAELKKAKEEVSSTGSLSDFAKKLVKDYSGISAYDRVGFSVSLKEKSKTITVDITIDSRDRDTWDKLSNTKQEDLVYDIVRDIQKEYKYPSIEGYLDAGSSYKESSIDFYTDKNDKVKYDRKSSSSSKHLSDLEDTLEKKYYNDFVDSVYAYESNDGYTLDLDVKLGSDSTLTSAQEKRLEEKIIDTVKAEVGSSYYDKIYVNFK